MKAWDEFDVYLFDIDGTLLNCRDAVHYFAFCDALTTLAGRPVNLDGVVTHGNTDVGILRDALRLADVPESVWRPALPATRDAMSAFVEARMHGFDIEATPGIGRVLDHLKARGAVLGVATGNLERIGRAKLRKAGVLHRFDFGGYSDEFEYRRDVFGAALQTARRLAGKAAAVCVVGDTPEDVRAAKACGLPVIAVATGIFPHADLLAEAPDWCLRSFLDVLPES